MKDLSDPLNAILGNAMVDTGATISSVPLWMVHRLGIAVSEDSKQPAFGVGGQIDAYCIQVGVEAWIDGTWTDNDVVPALSPDTEWSRRQRARLPILLGRNGFLSRYNVCFDDPNKAMWLRKAVI